MAMTATQEPTRCAIYLRQSLDATGEQLAVARQRDDCHALARQRGWSVVAEYVDNSISASSSRKTRPAYNDLLAAYRGGEFNALICWDLDRLTRQPRQLEDWIDAAETRGLLLVTANGEADLTTDAGRLFARIKAAVARAEMERKAARQARAALQRAQHGKPPLGTRLTGYTSAGDVAEHEAVTVRRVFERFAAGDSLRSLAAWLSESGVPTRGGGAWNPSSVRTMLLNPRYAGRAVYKGQENGVAGVWEAIVDEDTFALVTSRLADPRRRTQVGTDRKHLGAGLYVCGVCERLVTSWTGDRYRCPSGCLTRTQGPIDAFVLAVMRGRLARPDVAELLALAPEKSAAAQAVMKQIKALRARLVRISDDYDMEVIDGQRYRIATEKVKAELAQAQATQARMTGSTGLSELLSSGDPVAAFDAAPLMIRRSVIGVLVKVALMPGRHGSRTFDPDTVRIGWKS
jgi:DNA invertase Pin-like site-specific DNA recombinase